MLQQQNLTLAPSIALVLSILGLGLAAPAGAQDVSPLPLPRLAGTIALDGDLSDAAWQAVPPLELTVHTPRFGAPPSEQTVIRVAYDATAIYVGAWMFDSEPDQIKVYSVARDVDNGGDFLNLVIDGFNDDKNGIVLSTTPSGNRIDRQVRNDLEGPNAASISWNAFWDVAVTRDGRGWYAEVRLPFSSLRFEEVDGRVVMGLGVNRLIGRKNERHVFPAIPPNWPGATFKPSQLQSVSFEGIRARRPVFLTPYTASRHSTRTELTSDPLRYDRSGELDVDAGGDLKYALTNNLNLDLTANTDFAEVEVDELRVNLSRFSLFFPERRQFFLEREGTFDFGVSGLDRAFYSRRIGLTDDGLSVPIIAGGRLTGRVGGLDVGFLDMVTAASAGQPAENAGVLRLRQPLGERGGYAGLMAVSRAGGGAHSILAGGDVELRLGQNDYLTAEFARTFDSSRDSASGFLPAARSRVRLERRTLRGLGFSVAGGLTGADYRPTLGFVQRSGIWDGSADVSYGFLAQTAGLRRISPSLTGSTVGTNGRRNVETWEAGTGLDLEFNSSATLTADFTVTHEDLAEPFPLDEGVEVPAGSYRFTRASLGVAPAQGWRAGSGFQAVVGGYFGGRIVSLEATPFWNISPYARITGGYRFDQVVLEAGAEKLTAHVLRLRPELSLGVRFSTVATIQYISTADVLTLNLRLRYNFGEGRDLWLVYGHVANTDRGVSEPVLPRTRATALTAKFAYTFLR